MGVNKMRHNLTTKYNRNTKRHQIRRNKNRLKADTSLIKNTIGKILTAFCSDLIKQNYFFSFYIFSYTVRIETVANGSVPVKINFCR